MGADICISEREKSASAGGSGKMTIRQYETGNRSWAIVDDFTGNAVEHPPVDMHRGIHRNSLGGAKSEAAVQAKIDEANELRIKLADAKAKVSRS